jgi:hypothetical protein
MSALEVKSGTAEQKDRPKSGLLDFLVAKQLRL